MTKTLRLKLHVPGQKSKVSVKTVSDNEYGISGASVSTELERISNASFN